MYVYIYFPRSMRDTNRECTTARTECNYSCRGGDTIAKFFANGLFVKLAKHRLRRVIFGVDQDKCWADAAELAGDLFHLGRPEFGVQTIRCCAVLPRGFILLGAKRAACGSGLSHHKQETESRSSRSDRVMATYIYDECSNQA